MGLIVKIGANIDAFQKQMKKLTRDINDVGNNFKDVGASLTAGLTLPILGVGTAAGVAASQVSSAQSDIKNSLGLSADEAERLTEVAKGIYNRGFGESLDDVKLALVQTKQNIKDINDEDLNEVVTQAMTLAKTFDSEVNEVTRAGNNVMKGFGVSSKEAFDLMAFGAQNGLNFSNEMFDNLSEYAPLFGKMGYSADEYFQLLIQGSEAGVYNLDYINDAMKEFQIRLKDGSKSTSDAMGAMSEGTQKVWKDFLSGKATVKDVSNTVLAELQSMDNQAKANELGVALYGTKWEDLEAEAMYALGGIDGQLKNVEGTMGEMVQTQEQTFGQQFQSMIRDVKSAFVPLGETLIELGKDILPGLKKVVESISNTFSGLSPNTQKLVLAFIAITAAIGPFLMIVGSLIMIFGAVSAACTALSISMMAAFWWVFAIIAALAAIVAIVIYWDEIKAYLIAFWETLKQVFSTAWEWIKATCVNIFNGIKDFFAKWGLTIISVIMGPLGILGLLIYKNWESIKTAALNIWNAITSFLSKVWDPVSQVITTVWNFIKQYLTAIWTALKLILIPIFTAIKNYITNVWNNIKLVSSTVWNAIKAGMLIIWELIKTAVTTYFNIYKTIITTVWNAIKTVSTNVWNTIKTSIIAVWDSIKSAASSVWNGLKNTISGPVDAIKSKVTSAFSGMKSTALGAWEGLKSGMKSVINGIIRMVNKFISGFNTPAKLLNNLPGVNAPIIPSIPMLATGGNVSGSGKAIVGEAGPELLQKSGSSVKVTPLSSQEKAGGIGGALGSGVYEFNLSIPLDGREFVRKTIRFTAEELERMQKRSEGDFA